jgi:hypothetical protein
MERQAARVEPDDRRPWRQMRDHRSRTRISARKGRSCAASSPAAAPRRCGGHVAVHGRDKYLNLLACGGVALGSQ